MKTKKEKKGREVRDAGGKGGSTLPGYPSYPEKEDIFNRFREEKDINPEDIPEPGELSDNPTTRRAQGFDNDAPGSDLDIPGSELDDEMEAIGSEDEENNYYSLGGENHEDLEERKGEV
jgi:hypothetical protein